MDEAWGPLNKHECIVNRKKKKRIYAFILKRRQWE